MNADSQTSPTQPPKTPDLWTLAESALRHWPLCLLAGCLFAALGAAAAVLVTPAHYKATAMVRLGDPEGLVSKPHETSAAKRWFRYTQKELVRMPHVVRRALETEPCAELGMQSDPDTVEWIADSVELDLPSSSEIMRISVTHPRAETAHVLTNAMTEAYLGEVHREEEDEYERRLATLSQLHAVAEGRLSEAWCELQSVAKQLGCGDPASLSLQAQAEIENYRAYAQRLREIREEKREADRLVLSIREAPEMLKTEVPEQASMHSVKFGMFTAKLKKEHALTRYGKNHPDVRTAAQEEELLRQYYQKTIGEESPEAKDPKEEMLADPLATLANLKHEEQALQTLLQDIEQRLESLGGDSATKLEILRHTVQRMEKLCDRLWQSRENLQVERHAAHRVQPVAYASLPSHVDTSKRKKLAVVFAAGGFGFAIALFALGEFLTGRIHSIRDAKKRTGIEVLGALPAVPPQAVPENDANRKTLDAYDRLHEKLDVIVASLTYRTTSNDAQIILASNPTAREKGQLADHLAVAFARTGRRTVLVDLDFQNPRSGRRFERESKEGVSELVRLEKDLESLSLATGLPQLDFLPAGRPVAPALPVFANPAFAALFDRLKQEYEHVIVASPAVLQSADTLHVARFVDLAMLSIERNRSRTGSVMRAKERLETAGVPVLAAFLLQPPGNGDRPRSARISRPRRNRMPSIAEWLLEPPAEPVSLAGAYSVGAIEPTS